MHEPHTQRVALVTGGGRRLGRAIALASAEAGYDVMVTYRTSAGGAREVAALVAAMGRRCTAVRADMGDPGDISRLAGSLRDTYGRLDLLVNSAATFASAPLLDVDAEAWNAVMDVNVRGPHLLVRAVAPLLRDSVGSVVNLTDLSAFQPWTEYPHHAVSKAALAHLTRVQARALAPEIRVNAVAPGAVLPPPDYPRERIEALRARTPLRRLGTPDDVVRAVLFLADAPFVTGQILVVDGGRSLGAAGPPGGAADGT